MHAEATTSVRARLHTVIDEATSAIGDMCVKEGAVGRLAPTLVLGVGVEVFGT